MYVTFKRQQLMRKEWSGVRWLCWMYVYKDNRNC